MWTRHIDNLQTMIHEERIKKKTEHEVCAREALIRLSYPGE